MNEALRKMNLPPAALSTSRKAIGPGPDEFVKILLPENSLHRADEFVTLLFEIYSHYNGLYADFFPGIPELLHYLKGKSKSKLVIATNKSYRDTQPLAEKLHFSKWFDAVFTRDDVKSPKPAPDILQHACQVFHVPPERTLMIGDTDNDVIASRAAGIVCCLAKWGYASNQNELIKLCSFAAEFPLEIKSIINKFENISISEDVTIKSV